MRSVETTTTQVDKPEQTQASDIISCQESSSLSFASESLFSFPTIDPIISLLSNKDQNQSNDSPGISGGQLKVEVQNPESAKERQTFNWYESIEVDSQIQGKVETIPKDPHKDQLTGCHSHELQLFETMSLKVESQSSFDVIRIEPSENQFEEKHEVSPFQVDTIMVLDADETQQIQNLVEILQEHSENEELSDQGAQSPEISTEGDPTVNNNMTGNSTNFTEEQSSFESQLSNLQSYYSSVLSTEDSEGLSESQLSNLESYYTDSNSLETVASESDLLEN